MNYRMTGWIQITLWYTEESNREAEGWTVTKELINLIHDAIKYELHGQGVALGQIYPPFGQSKPEIKLAGF